MTLTPEQITIVEQHPLKNALAQFRAKLRDFNPSDDSCHSDVSELLNIILGHSTSGLLLAPDGKNYLDLELISIRRRFTQGLFEPVDFQALVESVVTNFSDIHIWEAVLDLVDALNPPPAPKTLPQEKPIPTPRPGTPPKSNSNAAGEDAENVKIKQERIFQEMKNSLFRSVKGFWEKFFDTGRWEKDSTDLHQMYKNILKEHRNGKWVGLPMNAKEHSVLNWFWGLERAYLQSAPNKIHNTSNQYQFEEEVGQVDIFFQKRTAEQGVGGKYTYKNTGVVGELKESFRSGDFKEDFFQMALLVWNIFGAQPTRRYVHSFMLSGRMMELWIFDRSGAYSSGIFNIDREPDKFARALVGYATMDDEMLGADTFIKSNGGLSVEVDVDGKERSIKLQRLMAKPPCAIITRGTVCYETSEGCVAKFAWAPAKRRLEVEYLQQARSRGVEGVAKFVGHRQITSTTELRQGLTFGKQHKFRLTDLAPPKIPGGASASKPSQSVKSGLGIEHMTISSAQNDASSGVAGLDPDSPGKEPWEERVFSCHLISPVGQVIKDFKKIKQLLESLRDAIRAHRSLYVEGNILHRDISSHNIIITDHTKPDTGGFKGMLIDLDLACIPGSATSGARYLTGTIQFMAVDVLRRKGHTYRHDVESFFYLLLWLCGSEAWDPVKDLAAKGEKQRKDSRFQMWHTGTLELIAEAKSGQMANIGNLRTSIMFEFPKALDVVKPLCEELWRIIFPPTDLGPNFGTPWNNPDELYDPIITAFDKAIRELPKEKPQSDSAV
ncbi:hypothetical protein E4U57_006869 [Claviceps arundinis]|uniref:EKC/KEOPS complex subunit BUD32 n=1 Tax=Claviceps arundinis TaxID=1623583 RepID=A0ABQ7P1G8_9HYPO|nr:hypothetical protein E4U57_006869 [Claviceps arundinis]